MKIRYIKENASLHESNNVDVEYQRLAKGFSDIDKQTFVVISPLLQQMAYILVTARDLQTKINVQGVTDHTKNGKKVSANLQAYTKLIQEYNDTMLKLLDIIRPKEKKLTEHN